MLKKKEIWDSITNSLKSDISKSEIKTWFTHTTLRKLDTDFAEIEVPNKFVAGWLRDNYFKQLQNSFKNNLDFLPEIRFTYGKALTTQDTPPQYKNTKKSGVYFGYGMNPLWSFGNFVTAGSNLFAYSSSMEVAKNPGTLYNPLYIFSKLSLGKTHLLNAIGNQVLNINPLANVGYISANRFSSDFSLSRKNREFGEFRENYRNLDFLLFDDIHLITGRKKSQEELISLFNSFFNSKKQIVVAAKTPPSQIKNLLPQLRSRLEWGLLSEIQIPDQKTKRDIIKKKAREEDLHLPDDVVFFLANATNDLKALIQYLISLETYASLYQRKVDMSIVKSIIKDGHTPNINVNVLNIQKVTAGHFNLSLSDLLSNKKKRQFSYPRQVAMYLSRNLTDLSYKEIGKAFGYKDHSTVIYAVKRIQKDKELKKRVLDDINNLQDFFHGS